MTSVTGVWGLVFLIHWTASVANVVWERGLQGSEVRWATGAWAGVLGAALLFGGARLAFRAPADTMPVAIAVEPQNVSTFFANQNANTFFAEVNAQGPLRDTARAAQSAYLDQARRAGQMGVQLVTWPEAAVPVPEADSAAFIDRARSVARKHRLYLAMGVAVLPQPDGLPVIENQIVWIGPEGHVRARFMKARPVPGSISQDGTDMLPTIRTAHGTWTSAICFDMDFPDLLRQAGQQGASLIVAPSNDWPAIRTHHAHMARVRAIENGAALVRPTSNGRTLVTGPLGRSHAEMDHTGSERRVQIAHVPTQGAFTLYPFLGDIFAWTCVGGMLVLVGRRVGWTAST